MVLRYRTFVGSVAVAAGLMVAAVGYAQTAAQTPPAAAPAAKAPAQRQAAAGRVAGVNLTQAQRDQMRALRETQRKDQQALREKTRAARQQLQQAMRADVPDEAAVRAAAAAVGALQADQAALQARSRAQLMKVLTPEQQAQLKQARARTTERAQRARSTARLQRQMMQRNRMMRPAPGLYRGWGRGPGPMGMPMVGPMWRQQQLRRLQAWRWRGWI